MISAQIVNPDNTTDIIFPQKFEDLANFTAVDIHTRAQITIPVQAIKEYSMGEKGRKKDILVYIIVHSNYNVPFQI